MQTGLRNLLDVAIIRQAEDSFSELGEDLEQRYTKIDELPFDFQRRRLSVLVRDNEADGEMASVLVCKGAVEEVLAICSHIQAGSNDAGEEVFSDESRLRLLKVSGELNDQGLRVLALATKRMQRAGHLSQTDEYEMVFQGFLAFLDPTKETAAEAIRLLHGSGVAVKVLTGDNAPVTRKVCRDVGISTDCVYTSDELSAMDRPSFLAACRHGTVFAKLTPHQKLEVVEALQSQGATVGFLGDGINDSLALRSADVGISVDSGSAVAKEAADMILLEKSLLILHSAVLKGRRTCGNTLKYIKVTAASNFGNVFSMLVSVIWLPFSAMTPIQILAQNILYDTSQIVIAWDRMDKEYLSKPRRWSAKSIAWFMLCFGPTSSLFDILTFCILWFYFGINTSATPRQQGMFQTAWFMENYLTQLLTVQIMRTEKVAFIQSRASKAVCVTALLFAAFVVCIPFTPIGAYLDGMTPPPTLYGAFLAATLCVYLVLFSLLKLLFIRVFGGLI
ncbi:hypothetical protein RI367_005229 [Sorochytrium milnesiophthora]